MNRFSIKTTKSTVLLSKFLFIATTIVSASANISFAQLPPAGLTIQMDQPAHAVSPTLYGLMTEEINYSYDGGLYAEMVRNRTFQDHGFGGVAHWNIVHMGDADASVAA